MKKVGVIGGTFDPIHLAHLYIAEEAKKKLNLDKVIFMPVGSQPLKQDKKVTEASLRFKMVQRAIEGYEEFEVSDYEINKKGISYTYETLEYLKNSKYETYFITGADCLISLPKWKAVDKIFKLCKFVVFTRPGISIDSLIKQKKVMEERYNGEIIFLEIPTVDLSSTEIREKLKNKEDISAYVPKKVLDIIYEENLYGSKENERN